MAGTAIAILAALPDDALRRTVADRPVAFQLYAALRREQRAFVRATEPHAVEALAILAFARSGYRELEVLLAGRDVLDSARDGEWTMRDLLSHAIAVELRYCAQILWSSMRGGQDPLAIPAEQLPCDRLTPPEPEFGDARSGDVSRVLELLGIARRRTDEELRVLSPAMLDRPSVWGSVTVDVRERLHQIAVHLVEVVIQAEKMLGVGGLEARRIARRIASTRGMHEGLTGPDEVRRLDAELEDLAAAT